MKKHQIIQRLEQDLYDLTDLDDEQLSQIDALCEKITDSLAEHLDIDDKKLTSISLLAQQRITNCSQHESSDFTVLVEQINAALIKTAVAEQTVPQTSLLAALYYFNDIIAASSDLGMGKEDSIYQNIEHVQAIFQLLDNIKIKRHDVLQIIEGCRYVKTNRKHEELVPLIFDIIEINYTRLVDWRCARRDTKADHVSAFYSNQFESCMAKGSLWILRELTTLPNSFSAQLASIALDRNIMKKLQDCSVEARLAVESGASTAHQSRGCHSWIAIRNNVQIARFFTVDRNSPTKGAANRNDNATIRFSPGLFPGSPSPEIMNDANDNSANASSQP